MKQNYACQEKLLCFSKLYFMAFSLLVCQLVHAKDKIQVNKRPAWVEEVQLTPSSHIKPEDVSDGYLYSLKDYQFHVEKKERYFHFVRKIYSNIGVQKASEIEVVYDPSYEKVVFHEIKIIRANESINKLNPDKFKIIQREESKESYIYDGSMYALLILDDVRAGDLIEYSFSIIGRNPIYADKFFSSFYLASYDPIDLLSIKIITSATRPLHFKNEKSTFSPSISQEGDNKIYRWKLEQIPGTEVDSDIPYWYTPYPIVWMSEFGSWKEVNDWALQLYAHPEAASEKLQKDIASIQKMHKSPQERLEAVLAFVQDEVRYTGLEAGIGGYKPRKPSEVFEQKFGDCKDKSLLLCFMLNQMGIEAYPALVNTTSRQEIKNRIPSPTAFNHCVAQVKLEGNTYWYDATIANQGGTYTNTFFPNYRNALVISPGTKDLTEIPFNRNSKTKVVESFMISKIGEPVELSVTTDYYGYEADEQRYYFANNNIKEIEKNYLNYTAKNYAEVEVSKPLLTNDNKRTNVFTTYENYKIINFWYAPDSTQPGNLECVTFPQLLRDKITVPERPKRTMPVGIEYPLEIDYTVNLLLPEPWTVPEEVKEIKNDATYFKQKTSYKNGVISLHYFYQTLKNKVEAKEIAGFIKKQNQIINQLGYSLTYNTTVTATSGLRVNWLMVLLSLLFLGISVAGVLKIYRYDPAPDQLYANDNPIEIGGWLALVAIGVSLMPLAHLIIFFSDNYFDLTTWENITNRESASYNMSLAFLLVGDVFFNLFFLVYSILLIVVFFKEEAVFLY